MPPIGRLRARNPRPCNTLPPSAHLFGDVLRLAEPLAGQRGDQRGGRLTAEEFAEAFRGAVRPLWIVAVAVLRDRTLADDAVQEAAALGLRKLDQFERGTDFTAWMSQMVRHVANNMRRKEQRRRGVTLGDAPEPAAGGTANEAAMLRLTAGGQLPVDQAVFDDRVVAALGRVSETARACLLLRTVEGLDYNEISRLLGIPPGTAMSHVHRSRATLRAALTADDKGQRPMGTSSA